MTYHADIDETLISFIPNGETDEEKTHAEDRLIALQEALQQSDEAFISINRQKTHGRAPEEFITHVAADKYTLNELLIFLQNEFGGGDYRLRLFVGKQMINNRLYSVAEPANKINKNESNNFDRLAQLILEQNERLAQMFSKKPEKTMVEQLEEIRLMQETFGMNKSNNQTQLNPIEQIRQSLELVETLKEMGGKDNEKEELGGMFTELMRTVNNMRQQKPAQVPVQVPAQVQKQPTEQENKKMQLSMQMKMGLSILLKAANKGSDAGDYAGMVMDMADAEQINQFLNDRDALDKIIAIEPQIGLKKQWFSDLIEHVKGLSGDVSSKFADEYDLKEEQENDKKESL